MPDFELSGPDGAKYQVTAPDENSALSAFQQLTGAGAAPAASPISEMARGANDTARSFATGVPILGGLANKANAATNALLAPAVEPFLDKSADSINDAPGATALERYVNRFKKSLAIQDAHDAKVAAEHPILDTTAKVAGGIASIGGALKAVPALAGPLGFEGTLPQMVTKGALSGAALSGVDEAIRGEDPVHGAEVGAITGAAGGPVGRMIGKGVEKVAGAFRKPAPLVHAETTPVAGEDIPVPVTDPVAASKIEIARRGGAGEPAQRVIQTGDEARDAALARAQGNIGTALDPAAGAARPPQDAAAAVAEELHGLEQQRFQTEQATRQRVDAGLEELRHSLDPSRAEVPNVSQNTNLSPVPGASITAEASLVRGVPSRKYEGVAQNSPLERGTEAQGRGAELRGGLPSPGQVDASGMPLRVTGEPNAPSELPAAPAGGMEVPPLSSGAPSAVRSPGAAAEVVGEGVAGRAARARAIYQADYKAAAGMPSRFEPSAFRSVGETVRARLNAGDNPVRPDSVTTPYAAKALQDLDTNVGLGNFQNLADSQHGGPLVGGPAAGSATDAEVAFAKLTGMGVPAAKARAQVAALPGADTIPGGALAPHEVAVPGGGAVSVAPKVVEASSVRTSADPGYDASLQPRNRARAASDGQINDIAANLNPNRLGASAEADRGAPIVGADGMVESGNGRVLALRKAYADNGPAADRYRAWLTSQGADISKLKEPVLVRERTTVMSPEERKAFTVAANQSSNLSMSASERALTDSRALTPESLSLIRNPADLGAVENRPFIRHFISKLPQAEQGAMVTAKGDLSSEGLARVRNAVIGKAYGDTPVLARIAESTDDEVKSISNALTAAAPEWAGMRASVAAGQVPKELDATKDLLDAVSRTARLRAKGISLADSQAQGEAFGKQTPESSLFQRMFYAADGEKAAPPGQVTSALRNYAQEAMKADAAPGLDLGLPPVTARAILEGTAAKVGAPKELAKSVVDAAEAAASEAKAAGKVVDLNAVDAARKRLVSFYQDAKADPRGAADARAVKRVLKEFDQFVIDTVDSPAYKGDPAALETLQRARAGVAAYHQQFSPRGPGDEVGRAVEKILGRYPGQHATPDQIAQMSYGSVSDPGGAQAVKVSQRLRQILGPTSPEWGAYKQGLLSHLVDTPPGGAARSAAETADRIDAFLNGTKGKPLAQVVLSADERAALSRHAEALRASEPAPLKSLGTVDKVLARITGRDGGPPASLNDVTDYLFGANSGKKGLQFQLATRLKRDLTPDGFNAVRTGMWSKLTGVTEGKSDLTPKRLSDNLFEFLNGSGSDLAKVLYTPAERTEMLRLAQAVKSHIPLAGSTNPSGTAPMIAKIAGKIGHGILPTVGLMHGGIPGAIAGVVADKGVTATMNSRNAKEAARLYYGPQPSSGSTIDLSKAAGILSRGIAQGQIGANR